MSTYKTSRELPVPPAAVFAAIQDPVRLARWWGPDGFTNTFGSFDFKPGGKWSFVMRGPDGKTYDNESVFSAIERDRKVVVRHVAPPLFTLTISLESAATGTLVKWEQVFDDPAVAAAFRHIVVPSNEQNLDRLTAEVRA